MPGQATVTINENQWSVSLATTSTELTTGLSGLESIPAGTGMLFILPAAQVVTVDTSQMLFPIDIIFIKDDAVLSIAGDISPGYLVTEETPCDMFLEVNAGEADLIEVGDAVSVTVIQEPGFDLSGVISFAIPLAVLGFVCAMAGGMARSMGGSSSPPKQLRPKRKATVECPICKQVVEIPEYDRVTRSEALREHIEKEHSHSPWLTPGQGKVYFIGSCKVVNGLCHTHGYSVSKTVRCPKSPLTDEEWEAAYELVEEAFPKGQPNPWVNGWWPETMEEAEGAAKVYELKMGEAVRSFRAKQKKAIENYERGAGKAVYNYRRYVVGEYEKGKELSVVASPSGHHSMWLTLEQRKELEKKYGAVAVRWAEEATRPGDIEAADKAAAYYYGKIREYFALGHGSPELTEEQIMKLREVLGLPAEVPPREKGYID